MNESGGDFLCAKNFLCTENFVDFAKKLTFTIAEVDGRRIEKVRVTIEDATEEEIEEQIKEDEEE